MPEQRSTSGFTSLHEKNTPKLVLRFGAMNKKEQPRRKQRGILLNHENPTPPAAGNTSRRDLKTD
jgi:hypothetical protein